MEKKRKWNFLNTIALLVLILLIVLTISIIKEYYRMSDLRKQYEQTFSEYDYKYHCAFINSSYNDTFWESVYESAREQGRAKGIYVEYFGRDLDITYSTDELLKMAIAARVDAIIVEATGEASTTDLINEAVGGGIAVSTIYKDDIDSSRFSYTGINNVSLGYEYGSLAIKHSTKADTDVMVLLDAEENAAELRLLLSGINKVFTENRPDARIDTLKLDNSNAFEIEEQVRSFLKENHDSTDIIICTTLPQTQYVSQAVVDLNYVGDLTIIGTYYNTPVLESLKNGVISANVAVNSEQMGRLSVENLAEYLEYGYASGYSQVEASPISKQSAIQMLARLKNTGEITVRNGGDRK